MNKRYFFLILFVSFLFSISPVRAEENPSDKDYYYGGTKRPLKTKTTNKLYSGIVKFIPIVDITAFGNFSAATGSDDKEHYGLDLNAIVSPALKIGDKHTIIPLYNTSYSEVRQIVIDELGGRVVDAMMDQNFTLEYKYAASPRWTYRIKGLTRNHYRKEENVEWYHGLYDYNDIGGGGSVEYFFSNDDSVTHSLLLGSDWYHRKYPHYTSLLTLANITDVERKEKDYSAINPKFRHRYKRGRFSSTLTYTPMYKEYDDKVTIMFDGTLNADQERRDWLHYANLDLTWFPEWSMFIYNMNMTGTVNDSNQNYYDSNNTPANLADDTFTDRYYNYKSLSLNPSIIYPIKLESDLIALFQLGYDYMIREYDSRRVQTPAGVYADQKQVDQTHTLEGQFIYPVTDQFSVITKASWEFALSNQKYETFYRYQYKNIYLAIGGKYSY